MTVVDIKLPPGAYKNGTPYAAKNRWVVTNRVRWHDGSLRPIGGWKRKLGSTGVSVPSLGDPTYEAFRDLFAWTLPAGTLHYAAGSNRSLKILDANNVLKDITPDGFVGSPLAPSTNKGYGKGSYDKGAYGSLNTSSYTTKASIYRWAFDNWGSDLLATAKTSEWRGNLYSYASGADKAVIIPNAPTEINGAIVTDQRHIMTIGSALESRIVKWSDVENREEWAPTISNQAGSFFLQGTGELVSINKMQNQILILSESDAHVARFVGSPFIFGFDRIGTGCGPLSAASVVTAERFAMWIGRRTFWLYDGTVRSVECPIMDFLAEDLDLDYTSSVTSCVISQYNELWWFYRSKSGLVVDSYVSFDYAANSWVHGRLNRSGAVDGTTVFRPVMISSTNNVLYEHEIAGVCVRDSYAETGPLELGTGEQNMAVRYVYPDTQTTDNVAYTFFGAEMPTAEEFTYGPYEYNNPMDTRAMGRQIRMRVDGAAGENWEVGPSTRFDIAQVGTGRR